MFFPFVTRSSRPLGRSGTAARGPKQRRPPLGRALRLQCLERRWCLAAGDYVSSFGSFGELTLPVDQGGVTNDRAADVAVQSDGKLVVVGTARRSATDFQGAVFRLNNDGSLDTSFGGGDGRVLTSDFYVGNVELTSVALQPDGKIVLAGWVGAAGTADFFVARLRSDGRRDDLFNMPYGVQMIDFHHGSSHADFASDVLVQPDGEIVVAGAAQSTTTLNYDFAVARLHASGSLDTTFSGDGKTTVSFDSGSAVYDAAQAVALQTDGKLVLAGVKTGFGGDTDMAVVRLNANGALDTTFDFDGRRVVTFGSGNDAATDVAVTSDGKIVLGGYAYFATSKYDFALARLLPSGALDPSFSGDGLTTAYHYILNSELAWAMALIPGDRIVLAGVSQLNGTTDTTYFAVARFNTDGTLDHDFGSHDIGWMTMGVASNRGVADAAYGVATDRGIIRLVGTATVAGNQDFGIVVLDGNDPATPQPDRYVLGSKASVNVATESLLVNDEDPDGNPLYVTGILDPPFEYPSELDGTATIAVDGTFSFTPSSRFRGYDYFLYYAWDEMGGSDGALVEIFSHTGALVAKAYDSVLGRKFDYDGLAYWVQRIEAGEGLSAFAIGVFESRERLEPIIKSWYRDYLGRPADPSAAEINYYYDRWRNEGGPQRILPDIFASAEFFAKSGGTNEAWVRELYRLIVERVAPPTHAELDYYLARLAAGESRQAIVRGFLYSPEKLGLIVDALYDLILGRAPTSGERSTEVAALGGGKTEKQLQLQLLDSSEFRSTPPLPGVGEAVRF